MRSALASKFMTIEPVQNATEHLSEDASTHGTSNMFTVRAQEFINNWHWKWGMAAHRLHTLMSRRESTPKVCTTRWLEVHHAGEECVHGGDWLRRECNLCIRVEGHERQ